MDQSPQILCIGAAHWDVIGRTGVRLTIGEDVAGKIERRPGGVALNIALGLARRGRAVSLCSVVGEDAAGQSLVQDLEALGVDCTHLLQIATGITGQYIAIEDNRGDLFAAIADASLLEQNEEALARRTGLALGSMKTILLEANLRDGTLQRIARAGRDVGVEIVANPVSPAKAKRLEFLLSGGFAPTIVANLTEANELLDQPFGSSRDAARALNYRSSGTALVTDGPRPATLATNAELITLTPPTPPADVSITGAGDAVLSAFLASPERHNDPGRALQIALDAAADHIRNSKTP